MADVKDLEDLAKTVRYWILRMTTKAGSGHPTSSLSATDLMVALFFGKLRYDLKNPENPGNDRVIFSKGHASPLLYALYKVAGIISDKEVDTYRKFESPLEGHPTPRFKYVEVATGSLGQGLSIGVGEALALRLIQSARGPVTSFPPASARLRLKSNGDQEDDVELRAVGNLSTGATPRLPVVFILMGDSEMSEGSIWEAIQIASFYKLDNLVGIIDVNRLGQRGETMLGWDIVTYQKRIEAFGWETFMVNGHDFGEINKALESIENKNSKPKMIIAKTIKGKGVSFLENQEGWHGKALPHEDFEKAVREFGDVDKSLTAEIAMPDTGPAKKNLKLNTATPHVNLNYKIGDEVATRKAYGEVLAELGKVDPGVVALDGEVGNSTFAEIFKSRFPERFYEMYIAEQNMVGVALGMSKRGFIPFVSTFAAFFTRAFDQIRMSAISGANIKFVGSHAGVSIGEDGPSQMGLEDFALFRAVFASRVFCPADASAAAKIVQIAANNRGIFYIRTNRPATPVIYDQNEEFQIGGSKVVRSTKEDKMTIVSCGVTLIEAIKAADELKKENIDVRVIDAYSIKPIDRETIRKAASETRGKVLTVEDHYFEGGLGEAVCAALSDQKNIEVHRLAVSKMPMSGKPNELLEYEGISRGAIASKIKEIIE